MTAEQPTPTALFCLLAKTYPDVPAAQLAVCVIEADRAAAWFGLNGPARTRMVERLVQCDLRGRNGGRQSRTPRLIPAHHERRPTTPRRSGPSYGAAGFHH